MNFPDVNYTFTAQEEDDEVGLLNYNSRLYDPVLGKFISSDTIVPDPGDPQSLNHYSYVRNNPLKYIDPNGNSAIGDFFSGIWDSVLGWLELSSDSNSSYTPTGVFLPESFKTNSDSVKGLNYLDVNFPGLVNDVNSFLDNLNLNVPFPNPSKDITSSRGSFLIDYSKAFNVENSRINLLDLLGLNLYKVNNAFNAGAHVWLPPTLGAWGFNFGSVWTVNYMTSEVQSEFIGILKEYAILSFFDIGVSARVSGLSGRTQRTERTLGIGIGPYGGLQFTFIGNKLDAVSVGLAIGMSSPITVTIPWEEFSKKF